MAMLLPFFGLNILFNFLKLEEGNLVSRWL